MEHGLSIQKCGILFVLNTVVRGEEGTPVYATRGELEELYETLYEVLHPEPQPEKWEVKFK